MESGWVGALLWVDVTSSVVNRTSPSSELVLCATALAAWVATHILSSDLSDSSTWSVSGA